MPGKSKKSRKGKKVGVEGKVEEERRVKKKNIKGMQEKQIRIFIVAMISLLIFIFIVYAFIQFSLKFSYAGLEFEKVREGDLILYRTLTFPIFLREDPRELRDIGIEGKVILQKRVGIGGDKEIINGCEDSTIAATTLALFYGKSGFEPFSATRDKEEAENFNITYVECQSNLKYSVILFEKSDENKIRSEGNCYILEINNCEVMDVTERFILASYVHSRGIEL